MNRALALARRGMGTVYPNPPVGAVVVRDGRVIGSGWHRKAGFDHAEVIALKQAEAGAVGADLYVTLEPCAHQGRTPACTDAILAAGIKRVFIAHGDPNSASGHGSRILADKGIEVYRGLEATRAAHLLAGFQSSIEKARPRILLKLASSLDGRLASAGGDSRWISSEIARAWVHRRREEADAILVGAGTAISDNPALTPRVDRGKRVRPRDGGARDSQTGGAKLGKAEPTGPRRPDRLLVDSNLRVPPRARLFADDGARRIVITTEAAPQEAEAALVKKGVHVWRVSGDATGRVDLHAAAERMGRAGYTNILCEGGAELSGALIQEQLVDVLYLFIAPRILLGGDGPSWTNGLSVPSVSRAVRMSRTHIRPMGPDWLVTAVPEYAQWSDPATVIAATTRESGRPGSVVADATTRGLV